MINMTSIVSLDIETTGLDPQTTQIGAVKFKERWVNGKWEHRIDGEWETLINPGRHIPPFITQLTGINDQMVLEAPRIQDVVRDLERFIGDAVILGHNIRFDLSFFRRFKILGLNEVIDTYEMASILPRAERAIWLLGQFSVYH
jgi:DNA polymerase III epsilon subunit family exonuclease